MSMLKLLSKSLFLVSLLYCSEQRAVPHISSYPYISPDTFRQFSDHVLDYDSTFDPNLVQKGDLIYVQAEFFEQFFAYYHPAIKNKYILINQEGDLPAPGNYKHYLDDDKLYAWFARNADCTHPKLHPIPIGIANQIYAHGNITTVAQAINDFKNRSVKKQLLYLNFGMTHPERRSLYALFSKKPFCTVIPPMHDQWNAGKHPYEHLADLAHHMFVLSPQGNGLDCHRTWEAMLMGCIPIVRTSILDPLLEDLPVLIIEDWNQVTEQFLYENYEKLQQKSYKLEKLYADYWLNLIKRCQEELIA